MIKQIKQDFLKNKIEYNNYCQERILDTLTSINNYSDNYLQSYAIEEVEKALEDMLMQALKFMRNVYGLDTDWTQISEDVIISLTFSNDGKNFKDRIHEHYKEYLQHKNQDTFKYDIQRILNTQSQSIFNHSLSQKIKSQAIECEIVGDNACSNCLDHLGGGRLDPKKLIDIPPYHPNCECSIVYYLEVPDLETADATEESSQLV